MWEGSKDKWNIKENMLLVTTSVYKVFKYCTKWIKVNTKHVLYIIQPLETKILKNQEKERQRERENNTTTTAQAIAQPTINYQQSKPPVKRKNASKTFLSSSSWSVSFTSHILLPWLYWTLLNVAYWTG